MTPSTDSTAETAATTSKRLLGWTFVELMRTMTPELPEEPTAEQVGAWVGLVELVQDEEFRRSMRWMVEHQAAERTAGDPTGLHHDLTDYVRDNVDRAVDAGVDPGSVEAARILDDLVSRDAATFGRTDSPEHRQTLQRRLEIAHDPRAERYMQLLCTLYGWPLTRWLALVFAWFRRALEQYTGAAGRIAP